MSSDGTERTVTTLWGRYEEGTVVLRNS